MWPWAHLALGYLVYVGYTHVRRVQVPSGWSVVFLGIGTQFPDVVDKPLAYWWAVFPEGRSFAHSVLVVVPICVAVLYVARYLNRSADGTAFAIGYGSHPVGDALPVVLTGEWDALTFLAWPILPVPDYEAESFAHHSQQFAEAMDGLTFERLLTGWNDQFVLQAWLTILVVVLWFHHGVPPLSRIRDALAARR